MANKLKTISLTVAFLLFSLLIPESCSVSTKQQLLTASNIGGSLKDIQKRGKLVALVNQNPFNYSVSDNQQFGYQYEMLLSFAKEIGVSLSIIVEPDMETAIKYLKNRKIDLIAADFVLKNEDDFLYSQPLFSSNLCRISNTLSFSNASKNIHLPSELMCFDTLYSNQKDIEINESKLDAFLVTQKVDKGEINEVITYKHIANAFLKTNSDLQIVDIAVGVDICWQFYNNAISLSTEVNKWLNCKKNIFEFSSIYSKYFDYVSTINIVLNKDSSNLKNHSGKGLISEYDALIKKYSKKIGWDWRLLAALIYQESKFNPEAISRKGAFGLMQLMPATANKFGSNKYSSPEDQIKSGVALINWIDQQFSKQIINKEERIKFILASYNIGISHIKDAQKLAEKYNANPHVWCNNVEFYLLSKNDPIYYNDSVVKSGKINATETYNFVYNVINKYNHYKDVGIRG